MTETRERLKARLRSKMEKRKKEAAMAQMSSKLGNEAPPSRASVRVGNFEFTPNLVVVRKGGTVRWLRSILDSSLLGPEVEKHQIQFRDPSFPTSKVLGNGDSFSVTFDKPGQYEYCCSNYTFMNGFVRVVDDDAMGALAQQQAQQRQSLAQGNAPALINRDELEALARELEGDSGPNGALGTASIKKKNINRKKQKDRENTAGNANDPGSDSSKKKKKKKKKARKKDVGPDPQELHEDQEHHHEEIEKKSADSFHSQAIAQLDDFMEDLDDEEEDEKQQQQHETDETGTAATAPTDRQEEEEEEEDDEALNSRLSKIEKRTLQLEAVAEKLCMDGTGDLEEVKVNTPVSEPHVISLAAYKAEPRNLTIFLGDTVKWVADPANDTQHAISGPGFDSGSLAPGEVFQHTFTDLEQMGKKLAFACSVFPWVKGTIKVRERFDPHADQYPNNVTGDSHDDDDDDDDDAEWIEAKPRNHRKNKRRETSTTPDLTRKNAQQERHQPSKPAEHPARQHGKNSKKKKKNKSKTRQSRPRDVVSTATTTTCSAAAQPSFNREDCDGFLQSRWNATAN